MSAPTDPRSRTTVGAVPAPRTEADLASELFLLEDLKDVSRTQVLAEIDLQALRAVADWIRTFVVKPHADLGRTGTVCPFVPGSVERRTLWLAAERFASRVPHVVELMAGYKRRLLAADPTEGNDADYRVIVVVFADLPADQAQGVFDEVLRQLALPSYLEDGVLFGPYYKGNETPAVHNRGFRPFQSPAPFLFVRPGVIGDWEFFLDDEAWLAPWAHRYGESGVHALADVLRGLPWRTRPS
jgi:hypothetical protein